MKYDTIEDVVAGDSVQIRDGRSGYVLVPKTANGRVVVFVSGLLGDTMTVEDYDRLTVLHFMDKWPSGKPREYYPYAQGGGCWR